MNMLRMNHKFVNGEKQKMLEAKQIKAKIGDLQVAFSREKQLLGFCLLVTFVWGMIAHAYGFLHGNFSHDSLNAFYATLTEERARIEAGRIFIPFYRTPVRGAVALPWVLGLLALFYIGLSVYMVVKLFSVKSKWGIVLIAGIMTTNVTVIGLTAAYQHDLDYDMLALFLAVGAVCFWKRDGWKNILFGSMILAISIGLYQSYIAVAITLIMLLSIMSLLNCEECKKVVFKGLRGILMLFCSGVWYFVIQRAICCLTNIPLADRTNALVAGSNYLKLVYGAYKRFAYDMLQSFTYPLWFNIVVQAIIVAALAFMGFSALKNQKRSNKALIVLLVILTPLGMYVTYILARGYFHDLMRYAGYFTYIMLVVVAVWYCDQSKERNFKYKNMMKVVSFAAIGILLWGNILTANTAYLKKIWNKSQRFHL